MFLSICGEGALAPQRGVKGSSDPMDQFASYFLKDEYGFQEKGEEQ